MNKEIFETINNRQTVKEYSDKKINEQDWTIIKKSIKCSPSSHGFEPYRILTIKKDNPLRKELLPLMWNQGVVLNADKLVFFISLKRETFTNKEWIFKKALRRSTKVLGLTGEEADKHAKNMANAILTKHFPDSESEGDHWPMKQAYIALGISMATSMLLGIGSTPMEGLEKNKVASFFLKHSLIKANETLAVVVAFGYAKSETSYLHWGTGKRVRDDDEYKFTEV